MICPTASFNAVMTDRVKGDGLAFGYKLAIVCIHFLSSYSPSRRREVRGFVCSSVISPMTMTQPPTDRHRNTCCFPQDNGEPTSMPCRRPLRQAWPRPPPPQGATSTSSSIVSTPTSSPHSPARPTPMIITQPAASLHSSPMPMSPCAFLKSVD